MRRSLLEFCRDEKGTTAIEYISIAALISVASIAAFNLIAGKMSTWLWTAANNLNS